MNLGKGKDNKEVNKSLKKLSNFKNIYGGGDGSEPIGIGKTTYKQTGGSGQGQDDVDFKDTGTD